MAEKDEQQIEKEEANTAVENENNVAEDVCEDIDKVLAALAEKNQLIEEKDDLYKRLQADFDNFRRRTRQEKEELGVVVTGEVIQEILPVIDNLERALKSDTEDASALMAGVEMIYKQLMQTMEKIGTAPIEAVGKQFDPNYHEAVMRVEDNEKEDGIVVDELQKGYITLGRVIRPSMVKVVSNS